MFYIRCVGRAVFAPVFAVILLSSPAADAQGVCNFLSGSQKTACHDAAVALANKKAADAQAKAAANQAVATSPASPDPNTSAASPSGNAAANPSTKPGDVPVNYVQKNTYRGGIEDCTGNNCSGSQSVSSAAPVNVEQRNRYPGGICTPRTNCSDGTISDQARRVLAAHDITVDDAVKCNSVYTVAHTFKMNGGDPTAKNRAALQQISSDVSSNDKYLWDLIYVLSPDVKQAPPVNRNNTMTSIRDHQIYNDLDSYGRDYQPLLDSYNACIAKGLPPTGLVAM